LASGEILPLAATQIKTVLWGRGSRNPNLGRPLGTLRKACIKTVRTGTACEQARRLSSMKAESSPSALPLHPKSAGKDFRHHAPHTTHSR